MSAYTTLLYTIANNILTITFNRLERCNALHEEMKKVQNEASKQKGRNESILSMALYV